MIRIAVIDNYDSFTFNLVHALENLDCKVVVYRNDAFDLTQLAQYDKILLSPGPGIPNDAGLLKATIQTYAPTKSILGVCLGNQAIGEVFGAKLINMQQVRHGVSTPINIIAENEPLFAGLGKTIDVGRYHSWTIEPASLPEILEITAVDSSDTIMSIRHKSLDVCGVQFHPESVLTPFGSEILQNWLRS